MALTLYELAGSDDRRFSPYCWRTRLALAHKGLESETVGVRFTAKDLIAFSGQDRVPVLTDGDRCIHDSWAIAEYLEEAYADRPPLFGSESARKVCRFVNAWADRVLHPALGPLIIADIEAVVDAADRAYFRTSRERRYGRPLDEVQRQARAQGLAAFRAGLEPVRAVIEAGPFLGGEAPAYCDYIVFGGFQWARCTSPLALLAAGDPVHAWRARLLGLFDGLAARAPGFPC